MFTVFPSLYEGWGLPVGESLAAGKICVSSRRASLPEVAGEFGTYIDIDDPDQCRKTISGLIADERGRKRQEAKIRAGYKPASWRSIAQAVVDACKEAAKIKWQEPYPYVAAPYSSELSFAWLGRDTQGAYGDDLLAQMVEARKGHFLFETLHEQSFLRGEDARAGGIWAEPETWGTWLCHAAGDVVLALEPNESQYYYVFLRLRVSGPVTNLMVKLAANGDTLWQGVLGDRPKNVVLRVRRKTHGPDIGWRLKLRAETSLTEDLRSKIAAVDGRTPTIGFERLLVVPENDLKTRLDALTNMLL